VRSIQVGRSVPDVVAPPPRHPRFPLVDGLRAIAVISVLIVHVQGAAGFAAGSVPGRLLTHLDIGVTIFFLISGFLLYRPFIAQRAGGAAPPATPDYAKRRVLRIYPAFWLVLSLMVIVPWLPGIIDGVWWKQYLLLQSPPVLPQTWSLSVEMSFYILLPLYAFAAALLARGRPTRVWMRAELVLLAALSTASVLHHVAFGTPAPGSLWGNSTIGYVFWFALGMGLAILSVGLGAAERKPALVRLIIVRPLVPWVAALALYVVLAFALPPSAFFATTGQFLLAHLLFGVVALLLLAPAVFGGDAGGLPRRLLAHPTVAWLGLISYGIFLWHMPTVLYLSTRLHQGFAAFLLATLAISIACATISYYLVERPLLRLKYRRLSASWRERQTAAPAR
jgi:peptidoglycan/LPS O-acetylase OafA/YrhL